MTYIYSEPETYLFKNFNGHDGKKFTVLSSHADYLLIDCAKYLTMELIENECEFAYYVLQGQGYFVINGERNSACAGQLVVVPPGHHFTFGGTMKMLLICTPPYRPDQEIAQKTA